MAIIHMIRSVKGGSGKTAFALRKVVDLAREKKKVLYLDTDVHASETFFRLYKQFNKFNCDIPNEKIYFFDFFNLDDNNNTDRKHFLNTYIHPYKGYYSKLGEAMLRSKLMELKITPTKIDRVLSEADLLQNEEYVVNKNVQFIFADPSKEGRDVFGNIFQSSGKSAVGVGTYVAKMKNLLHYVLNSTFSDIVIDMPPGSDMFSEHLADLVINMSGNGHQLYIYYITTSDLSHLSTSADAAISHLHQMKSAYIERIFYVYNHGRDNPHSEDQIVFNEGEKSENKSIDVSTNQSSQHEQRTLGSDEGKGKPYISGKKSVMRTSIEHFESRQEIIAYLNELLKEKDSSIRYDQELQKIDFGIFLGDMFYYYSQHDAKRVMVFSSAEKFFEFK